MMKQSFLAGAMLFLFWGMSSTVEAATSESAVRQGILTFSEGEVLVQLDKSWVPVEEGDRISETAQVKTGKDSSCEIQFDQLGVIHLAANTLVSLKTIGISSLRRSVSMTLLSGVITAKVSKLVGDDRFQIRTKSVVCGVRGTRFVVNAESDANTTIAVAEGQVALIPPSFDGETWENLLDDPDQAVAAREVLTQIVETSVKIDGGNQIAVPRETLEAQSAALDRIQKAFVEAARGPHPEQPGRPPEAVGRELQAFLKAGPPPSSLAPRPLDPGMRKTLRDRENLKLSETPPGPKGPRDIPMEKPAGTEPPPKNQPRPPSAPPSTQPPPKSAPAPTPSRPSPSPPPRH